MTPSSDQQGSRFNATAITAPAIETPRFLKIVSIQLMQAGATDMGDDAERKRVERVMKEASATLHAADRADPERWPLPSLWEEVTEARARDEWGHIREFAGPSEKPDGGSSPGNP